MSRKKRLTPLQQFEQRHEKAEPRLKRWLTELRTRLTNGIRAFEETRPKAASRWFRIRLQEDRAKDSKSLFEKVSADPSLSLARALETDHVRDLLGARLVCHNLSDVKRLKDALEKGDVWKQLTPLKRDPDNPKDWTHTPHESGYRGCHVDVRWRRNNEKARYAEVQIRTLLQDAWATYMHDDIYKSQLKTVLGTPLYEEFKDLSNILYTLDQIFDRLRLVIEEAQVAGLSIKALEAITEDMTSFATLLSAALDIPHYTKVSRHDYYVVDPKRPEYRFDFVGHTRRPSYFVFPIGGDTPATENFELKSILRREAGKLRTPSTKTLQVITDPGPPRSHKAPRSANKSPSSPNIAIILDKVAQRTHDYQVKAIWKGIFDLGREYVFCPGDSFYQGAILDYRLTLEFRTHPRRQPRVYDVADYDKLATIWGKFYKDEGGLISSKQTSKVFSFDLKPAARTYVCLFEI